LRVKGPEVAAIRSGDLELLNASLLVDADSAKTEEEPRRAGENLRPFSVSAKSQPGSCRDLDVVAPQAPPQLLREKEASK
jgi:hypothetical protein